MIRPSVHQDGRLRRGASPSRGPRQSVIAFCVLALIAMACGSGDSRETLGQISSATVTGLPSETVGLTFRLKTLKVGDYLGEPTVSLKWDLFFLDGPVGVFGNQIGTCDPDGPTGSTLRCRPQTASPPDVLDLTLPNTYVNFTSTTVQVQRNRATLTGNVRLRFEVAQTEGTGPINGPFLPDFN